LVRGPAFRSAFREARTATRSSGGGERAASGIVGARFSVRVDGQIKPSRRPSWTKAVIGSVPSARYYGTYPTSGASETANTSTPASAAICSRTAWSTWPMINTPHTARVLRRCPQPQGTVEVATEPREEPPVSPARIPHPRARTRGAAISRGDGLRQKCRELPEAALSVRTDRRLPGFGRTTRLSVRRQPREVPLPIISTALRSARKRALCYGTSSRLLLCG
jgi:hypothetical protein